MTSLKFKEITCYLFTTLVLLSGLVIIGFATYLCIKLVSHFKFVPNEALGPFFLIILAGLAHLFITWFGKKGPSSEHDFFIIIFVILCALLLIFEFFVGVWSLILRSEVEVLSTQLLEESQASYFQLNSYVQKDWDNLEAKLGCCGLNGTSDYFATGKYPVSCFKCDEEDSDVKKTNCLRLKEQQSGCKEPLINYVKDLMLKVSLIGFLSALFQVLGIVCYVMYYKALKEERAIRAANRASRMRLSLSAHTGYINRRTANDTGPSAPT